MRLTKLYFLVILVAIGFCSKAQDNTLTIISHPKGAPSALKFTALKSILKGEKERWPDGTRITIALMKTNTSIGTTTCKKIYNMSGDELNKYWLALVFQGKGHAPVFFNSTADLEAYIASTPGAIGVTIQPKEGTQNILIDGKRTL